MISMCTWCTLKFIQKVKLRIGKLKGAEAPGGSDRAEGGGHSSFRGPCTRFSLGRIEVSVSGN